MQSQSEVLGIRTSTLEFEGTQFSPSTQEQKQNIEFLKNPREEFQKGQRPAMACLFLDMPLPPAASLSPVVHKEVPGGSSAVGPLVRPHGVGLEVWSGYSIFPPSSSADVSSSSCFSVAPSLTAPICGFQLPPGDPGSWVMVT